MKNDTVVVVHHRVGIHRHRKAVGQLQYASLNPLASVLEALAGQLVASTQKGNPDTPGNDVIEPGLALGNKLASWIGHGLILAGPR